MGFAPGILRALLKLPEPPPLRLRITCRQHPRIRKPAIQPGGNQFHQLPIGAGPKLREFFSCGVPSTATSRIESVIFPGSI